MKTLSKYMKTNLARIQLGVGYVVQLLLNTNCVSGAY